MMEVEEQSQQRLARPRCSVSLSTEASVKRDNNPGTEAPSEAVFTYLAQSTRYVLGKFSLTSFLISKLNNAGLTSWVSATHCQLA